jgi:hypothetical protein
MANPSSVTEDLADYSLPSPSFSTNPDLYDSLIDQPPPSILPSEASSALASDSDLPSPSSTKAKKQTDLHSFFLKMPGDELHAKWGKRKRDNEDRDREESAKQKQKAEAQKLHKQAKTRANNKVSQRKRRDRLEKEKSKLFEAEQDSTVSLLVCIL